MRENTRYSLVLTAQLAGGTKTHGFLQEKQAGLYQGKYKSLGPDVATGGCCQKWAMLTDTQQSPVIPKTCGSCKNNPPPSRHTQWTLGTNQSLCPVDREYEMCFFLRVSPMGMMYAWVRGSVWVCAQARQGLFIILVSRSTPQNCNWYWFRWDLVCEWCCFLDKVLCQSCPT